MSRKGKIVVVISAVVVGIWAVIYFTHVLDVYRLPTSSLSPVMEAGDIVMTSSLIEPKRYDYIAFEWGQEIHCKQVVGMPGDQVEFMDGYLYVNGRMMDDSLPTKFAFEVSRQNYIELEAAGYISEEDQMYQVPGLTGIVFMEEDSLKKWGIPYGRITSEACMADTAIIKSWGHTGWNADYFGPVRVPEGAYFVAGNNRKNSFDSRYIGFVSKTAVVGTAF